jgi:hypothetical protein
MRNFFLMATVFGLLAIPGSAWSQQAGQAAPKEHAMTGCLKKGTEANTYMLTDVEGAGPKTIGVVSSAADLAPHVGHKIEVTGAAVPAAEAEADAKIPKAQHYMKLSAAKMIAATCP